MQKIVFFITQNDSQSIMTSNIGNLYMNRFIIDEDASNEIVKIYEDKGPPKIPRREKLIFVDKEQIGMGHIFLFMNILLFKLSSWQCQR